MSYQFFSESDIGKDGKVKSEYPTWYDPTLLEEISNEIAFKERTLAMDGVPAGSRADFCAALSRLKEKYAKMSDMTLVEDSKNDKGKIADNLKEMEKIISSEVLPKQSACDRGIVDANREYEKLTKPSFAVKSEEMANMLKAANVDIVDGKVSGQGLIKAWQIGSKYIGNYANVETLRK